MTENATPQITPGPWKTQDRENAMGTWTVFHGPHAPSQFNQVCQVNFEADAKAIAALPDLLSVLTRIYDQCCTKDDCGGIDADALRTALWKAGCL